MIVGTSCWNSLVYFLNLTTAKIDKILGSWGKIIWQQTFSTRSTKQGKNQHHVEQTDETETTKKDIIEEKNDVDAEVGPVVDKVQPTLDEELGKGNSSRQTAPEARETCPRQQDPLSTLKTGVANTTSQSGFWGIV